MAVNWLKLPSLVVSGKVKPHVDKTFRLEEAAEAMAVVEHGGSAGKVVLSLD
jgi:NADPH:quinone reductase-like Zn-dependent oxidoreductase